MKSHKYQVRIVSSRIISFSSQFGLCIYFLLRYLLCKFGEIGTSLFNKNEKPQLLRNQITIS